MWQAQGKNPTTRQSTKSVSTRSMSLEIVGGGGVRSTGSGVMCPLSNVIFISVVG